LRAAASLALIAVLGSVHGCGSSSAEPTFGPSEFVTSAKRAGAHLDLGPALTSREGITTYEVRVAARQGDKPAGAALLIAETEAGAIGRFEECDATVTLVCFRAANAILYLEDPPQPLITSITRWMGRL